MDGAMAVRVRQALVRAGMEDVPAADDAPLFDGPPDSLTVVLLVSELQREFSLKIPVASVTAATVHTVAALTELVRRAGANR